MNNPLANVTRPKALLVAIAAAGAIAATGAVTAINVGLLSGQGAKPLAPKTISISPPEDQATTAPAPELPPQIVYQDVYDRVSSTPAVGDSIASSPDSSSSSSDDAVSAAGGDDTSASSQSLYESDDDSYDDSEDSDDSIDDTTDDGQPEPAEPPEPAEDSSDSGLDD